MTYAWAQAETLDAIPVIDITPLRDGSDPQAVARALHEASQSLGFIYVRGHGIPEETIERARASALAFFRLPEEVKARVTISRQHRGWLGPGTSKMDDDMAADLKESFLWGYQDEAGNTPSDHPLRGANLWPADPPDMMTHCMRYFREVHEVAYHLMRGFALGLGLDDSFFLRSCARPLSRASYVYYQPQTEDMGEDLYGVGPHTDFGVLTVLCQDSVGGLQVEDVKGRWFEAPPVEGTLVVNVGDLLARWTDGAYKSTPHRVINRSGRERLSLVLAFDPDPETMIDPREVFGADYPAKEPPITCGDYLVWRFNRAFTYSEP